MNKDQLLARAQELQIEVPDGATNKQIESLIKRVESLINELSIEKENKTALTESYESALKTKDEAFITEKTRADNLESELNTANETIETLTKKLEVVSEEVKATKGTIVELKGKTYEFAVESFRFKGVKYNAKDVVDDTELIEALVKGKFVHLKQQ